MVVFSTFGFSQAQGNTDVGLWNDIQFTKPINKTADLLLGVRFDTKKNSDSFAEQRLYGGFNLKKGRWSLQPWVVYLKNFSKTPYYEVRPQVTVGYKFTVNKFNITPKVRLEYHAKHKLKDDGRVVPIITFDRKITKNYGLFQTTEFWIPINNDKDVAKYRKRFFFGVTRTVNPRLSIDMFYLYQRDEQVNPKNSHKFGLTWKIK